MNIEDLITLLNSYQAPNGSFLAYAGNKNFSSSVMLDITFITSLILSCLKNFETNPTTKIIIAQGVNFLKKEKNSDWSWNYWQKNSPKKTTHPYPNDWDSTACALTALSLYQPEIITPEALAQITKLLIATETKPGGPYNTWLTNNSNWTDIDPVVNANIAYFLKQQYINLLPLNDYFATIIKTKNYHSRYYFSPITVIYFINRVYSGSLHKIYCDYLLRLRNSQGVWNTITDTTLALSVLLSRGYDRKNLQPIINYLLTTIKNPLNIEPLYIETITKDMTIYSGSKALTIACILEVLGMMKTTSSQPKKLSYDETAINLHNTITAKVKKRLSFFSPNIKEKVDNLIEKIFNNNEKFNITLLPYYFYKNLRFKPLLKESILEYLGQASLYGWIAYTIYDDIMDDDSDPLLLPVANTCLRELMTIYTSLLTPELLSFFKKIMDVMEKTNSWERLHCRISTTKDTITPFKPFSYQAHYRADKSLPFAFGPIILLYQCGYNLETNEIKALISFFKNYLNARQLHDDAHDIFSDFKKGFLNSVSLPLYRKITRIEKEKNLKLSSIEKRLYYYFWTDEIITIAKTIDLYLIEARKNLLALNSIFVSDRYRSLLDPLQTASDIIKKEKNSIQKFYNVFRS